MKWYAGSDHAGLQLKLAMIAKLKELGDEIVDVGTHDEASRRLSAISARTVGRAVAAEPGTMGLVVCGSGIGIGIAANKVAGVRCALVHDSYTAEVARQHNDANVVAMGGRVIGVGVAEAALVTFRATAFLGGRHARRVEKLAALDHS